MRSLLPDASINGRNGVKTGGIRYQPDLHAQVCALADLRKRSLRDEVVVACDARVETPAGTASIRPQWV